MTAKMLRAFSLAEVGHVTSIVVCGHKSTAWAYMPKQNTIFIHQQQLIDCIGQLATWAELSCLIRSRQYALSPKAMAANDSAQTCSIRP